MAVTALMSFQNYAGLRGQTQDPHPYLRFSKNDGLSTCGFIFTDIGMVGNSWLSPVNRQNYVRAALHECLRKPRGTKMIRFPPSPRDQLATLATEPAHLLRLNRIGRPCLGFPKIGKPSTCGFYFAKFGMVEGNRLNVVDRRISWQTNQAEVQNCPRPRKIVGKVAKCPAGRRLLAGQRRGAYW